MVTFLPVLRMRLQAAADPGSASAAVPRLRRLFLHPSATFPRLRGEVELPV